jgi:hypothetical protein
VRAAAALAAMLSWLGIGVPTPVAAETWTTDALVGVNQVEFTIDITCPATSFVCDLIDGYSDTRFSTLSGAGGLVFDSVAQSIHFGTDGLQDVGAGPQPAFFTLSGTPMTFATIPFAGIPEIENLLVFSLSDVPIDVPGLSLVAPGDYPFSVLLGEAATADVIGDLELSLPDIVVPAQTVTLAGVVRVLGNVDADSWVEYELLDVTASLDLQLPGNIGGEPVDIDVTASLTANLSGEAPGPTAVPGLDARSSLVFAALALAALGPLAFRKNLHSGSSLPL